MKKYFHITPRLTAEFGLDDVFAGLRESDRVVKRMEYSLAMQVPTVEVAPEDDHYVIARAASVRVDSDGEIVLPEGLDYSRYQRNPVVLLNHDLKTPVGFCESWNVEPVDLTVKMRMAPGSEGTRTYNLMKAQVLRSLSIGFIRLETLRRGTSEFVNKLRELQQQFPDRLTAQESAKCNAIVTKALLLEVSILSIGANPDALVLAVKSIEGSTLTAEDPATAETVKNIAVAEPSIRLVTKGTGIRKVGSIQQEQALQLYVRMWGL